MDRLEEKMSIAIPELPSADAGTHIPRSPVTHELKIFPEFFQYVQSGAKTFELRRDDRDYQTGDHLLLREWAREGHFYTGRDARRQISYVLRGWDGFGLQPGFCILALAPGLRGSAGYGFPRRRTGGSTAPG